MPHVFVVQDSPGKNLLPATKYGELIVLSPASDHPYAIGGQVKRIFDILSKNFTASRDFLLPIGDPVLIGISCAIMCELSGGKVHFLKYDRQERKYIPVLVDLPKMVGVNDGPND